MLNFIVNGLYIFKYVMDIRCFFFINNKKWFDVRYWNVFFNLW